MRRREFIAVLGGATAWPLAGHTEQTERMRVVGVLSDEAPSLAAQSFGPFADGLRDRG
jgi:hypothetical protein